MSHVLMTPLIGLPQATGWSQVIFSAQRTFVCTLAIAGVNAGNVGRDVAEELLNCQPESAAELHTIMTNTLKTVHDRDCELQLAAVVQLEGKSILGAVKGTIMLKRADKVGVILKSDGEVLLVEGTLRPDDVYVLATVQAQTFLGEVHQKLSHGFDIDTIVTSVVPGVHGLADSSLVAIAFLRLPESREHPGGTISNEDSPAVPLPLQAWPAARVPTPETVEQPSGDDAHFSSPMPTKESDGAQIEADRNRHLVPAASRRSVRPLAMVVRIVRGVGRRLMHFSWQHTLIGSGQVYVGRSPTKKWFLGFLILVLCGSAMTGGWWRWRQVQAQERAAIQADLQPLREEVQAAQAQLASDPLAARERVAAVVQRLQTLQTTYAHKRSALAEVTAETESVQKVYEAMSGKDEMSDLAVFFDLRLVQSDFIASQVSIVGKQAYFLDSGKKQVLRLDLETKRPELLPLAQLGRVTDLTTDESSLWLLGNGIFRAKSDDPTQLTVVKEEGDSNKAATFIGAYNRYVYIANPEKRNIFRYAPQEDAAYSDPIGWLRPGSQVDLATTTSLAIDGDIWLGNQAGEIIRLTSGSPVEFKVQGLSEALSTSIKVFTNPNLDKLYVLEPAKERLVVLGKDGVFLRQVTSPTLAAATALAVSPDLSKILLVSGSLVFEIPL